MPRDGFVSTNFANNKRLFWRYGVNAISENETVDLANRALDEGADLIILEVNALIFDSYSAASRGRCDQPARRQRIALKKGQIDLTSSWMNLLGLDVRLGDDNEPADLDRHGSIDPAKVRDQLPSHLRGPCDKAALVKLAQRARRQGSRLILMAPPRSATAERLLGAHQSRAIDQAAAQLAKDLGIELFAPARSWPDDLFVSIGHLGRVGRMRFTSELTDFLRQPA